jgi:tetratricopeptide (TPR) repeat protein
MRRLATALLLALVLAAGVRADQDDPRLGDLFARLQATPGASEARAVEQLIWQVWSETEDDDVRLLMRHGIRHMERGEHALALAAFDDVVARAPRFAEGWNKRATVHFLMADYAASVADIERTLALEPRHFGALSGLGQICLALGRKEEALRAFEAALALAPHLDGVRALIEETRRALEGVPT